MNLGRESGDGSKEGSVERECGIFDQDILYYMHVWNSQTKKFQTVKLCYLHQHWRMYRLPYQIK